MEKCKILLIEDDSGDAFLFNEILDEISDFEFEIVIEKTLADSLKKLDEEDFDLIITDLGLPDSKGLDTFIKLNQDHQCIPIIVLTGLSDIETGNKAINLGAQDYLLKGGYNSGQIYQTINYSIKRKSIENALRENKEKYSALYNSIRDAIIVTDTERQIIECNDAFSNLFGYSLNEIKEKETSLIYISKQEFIDFGKLFVKHLKGKKPFLSTIFYKKKNGEIFPGEINVSYLLNSKGEHVGYIGLIRDISERVKAEKALKESEEKFRSVLENVQLVSLMLDIKGRLTFVNDYFLNLTGWSKDEVIGKDWFENFLPEDVRDEIYKMFHEKIYTNELPVSHTNEIITKSGARRLINWNNTVHYNEKGKPESVTSIGEDITEKAQAQQEIKNTKKELETFFSLVPDMICVASSDGDFKKLNNSWERVLGYTKDELFIRTIFDLVHPEDVESTKAEIEKHKTDTSIISFKNRYKCKDGNYKWLEWLSTPVIDDNLYAVARDITERLRAEQALQESEKQYRTLFEATNVGIGISTLSGQIVSVNEAMCNIFEYSKDEFENIDVKDLYYYETERESILDIVQNKGNINNYHTKMISKSGRKLWVLMSIQPFNLRNDNRLLTVISDITKQKEAEIALLEQEKKFRTYIECSPTSIFIANNRGKYEFVNTAASKLLGYSQKELLELSMPDLTIPDKIGNEFVTFNKIKEEGYVTGHETNLKKKDGSLVEILLEAVKLSDDQYIAFCADISAIKDYERKLKEKNEEYYLLNEELQESIKQIQKINQELIIEKEKAEKSEHKLQILFNETEKRNNEISCLLSGSKLILQKNLFEEIAKEFFDYCKVLTCATAGYFAVLKENGSENEILFLDDGGLTCNVDTGLPMPICGLREQAYKLRKAVCDNNFSNSGWDKYLPDGHVKLKNVLFAPLIIKNKAVGLIALANKPVDFDEDDLKIATAFGELASLALNNSRNIEDLKIAIQKAEESDRLKTSFLANMSHEIRTPMNGILGFSDLLAQPDLTDEKRHTYLDVINHSCKQLLGIVGDILDISKIESGQIEIINEYFNVKNLIESNYDLFKLKCSEKDLNLKYYFNVPEKYYEMFNDKTKINQIITNLINNAIKFTPKGEIEIGCEFKSNQYEFYVKDTGIGIDKDNLEKIFDRFVQIETDYSRTYGGNGLGLSIAKAYSGLLGGNIWVESEMKRGSKFCFTIPVNREKKEEPGLFKDEQDFAFDFENKINKSNISVLVAEDEDINYMCLEEVLAYNELQIYRAKNGVEAIEICKNKKIDLILMDIKMPIMDGYKATREIRNILPDVPIIAQTAYAQTEDRVKAIEAGCNDYIAKPIQLNELVSLINEYVK